MGLENRESFGLDADGYRQFRPHYPPELYEYLAGLAPSRSRALDCATGSGQAAIDLARWFDRVDAFDASETQIDAGVADPKVHYSVGSAEALQYPPESFDLIAAAQAAHWFDLPDFYREVRRVGRLGAIIAIWGYSYCRVAPSIDATVRRDLLDPIEPYWADGNKVIRDRYATIEFPFSEFVWPDFTLGFEWTRRQYLQYLGTWSAVRKYRLEAGSDPLETLDAALATDWNETEMRTVQFEFVGRAGRIE